MKKLNNRLTIEAKRIRFLPSSFRSGRKSVTHVEDEEPEEGSRRRRRRRLQLIQVNLLPRL